MTNAPSDAARPAAIRSPQHLNEAIRLTSRLTWIMLAGIALCATGIVVWSFIGRLDFHATGNGVLLRDRSEVADVVATVAGTVATIHVQANQKVATGDILVSIKLDELQARRDAALITLDAQRNEAATYAATSRADVVRRQQNLDQQALTLRANLSEAERNRLMLRTMYDNYALELQRGLTTREQLQTMFDRLSGVEKSIRDMIDRLATLKTQQVEFENTVARNLADLGMKVIDARARHTDLQVQFDLGSKIRSPAAGTVSEITTQVNEAVISGQKVIVVESGTGARRMVVHAYFSIGEGKRVASGMSAEVSPSSIDERIYGSIRGTVTKVGSLPMSREGLLAVLGTPALVDTMMAKGAPIEVEIALVANSATGDGLSWTSSTSPPTAVTPGTTATSRIVVDRVRPVALILPMAKVWTGQ